MSFPKLTESMIRAGATAQSFQRGQAYYHDGAISNTTIQGNVLAGECAGTSAPYYSVHAKLDEGGIASSDCTCPYEFEGYCKHVVALLLTYIHHPKQFAIRAEPADLIADLDRDDLAALLIELMHDRPELSDRIEAALSTPQSKSKSKKTKRKKIDLEVYRRQITGILHSLDGMRMSEAYWQVGGLANELRDVQTSAMKFLDVGDAETALEILLMLADEAGHGIEFIDDSDGELGGFADELGQSLAEAILSIDWSKVAREKLVTRLKKMAAYLDDYGMEGGLELAIAAATTGWADDKSSATPDKLKTRRSRFAAEDDYDEEDEGEEDFDDEWDADDNAGRPYDYGTDLIEAKLNVLDRQGRTDEYLALAKQTQRHLRYALKLCDLDRVPEALKYALKHLASSEEAHQMAERLRSAKHIAESIAIGERGLELSGSKARLGEWLGAIEEAQGRTKQALDAWLAALPENPSLDSYKTIKRLAAARWTKLQPEAMKLIDKFYDKLPLAEVLLFEQEWDRVIDVAERRSVSYQVMETVADAVVTQRPQWVVQMSLKQAERLMIEVKSQNYPIAANWLKKAKKAYKQLGQLPEWQAYLDKTKEKYKRRPALQKQLRQL
jgi:uncharacterized Zn finger protein